MAQSTCVKCDNDSFEIIENTDYYYAYWFVQCTNCGGVVGVLEYYNIGNLIYRLANKLGIDLDD